MIEQRRTPLRPKVRLELIDALRGFTLLNMLIFHLLYDLTALFGVPMDWFWQTPGRLWQKLIAGSFIFLSGFSIRFSRSSLRKGLMLLGCGDAAQPCDMAGDAKPADPVRGAAFSGRGGAALDRRAPRRGADQPAGAADRGAAALSHHPPDPERLLGDRRLAGRAARSFSMRANGSFRWAFPDRASTLPTISRCCRGSSSSLRGRRRTGLPSAVSGSSGHCAVRCSCSARWGGIP